MDKIVQKLATEMTPEMIPEGIWREVAEEIGIINLVKVLDIIGGVTLYAPKPDMITRTARDIQIKKEFTGYNHQLLAKKYNLTERTIRELCGTGCLKNQISLFETI